MSHNSSMVQCLHCFEGLHPPCCLTVAATCAPGCEVHSGTIGSPGPASVPLPASPYRHEKSHTKRCCAEVSSAKLRAPGWAHACNTQHERVVKGRSHATSPLEETDNVPVYPRRADKHSTVSEQQSGDTSRSCQRSGTYTADSAVLPWHTLAAPSSFSDNLDVPLQIADGCDLAPTPSPNVRGVRPRAAPRCACKHRPAKSSCRHHDRRASCRCGPRVCRGTARRLPSWQCRQSRKVDLNIHLYLPHIAHRGRGH